MLYGLIPMATATNHFHKAYVGVLLRDQDKYVGGIRGGISA